jgi:Ca2+ transporting ATPase
MVPQGAPREYTVEGTTFSPHGSVYNADGKNASAELKSDQIQRLAEINPLCNDAKVVYHAVCLLLFPINGVDNKYLAMI